MPGFLKRLPSLLPSKLKALKHKKTQHKQEDQVVKHLNFDTISCCEDDDDDCGFLATKSLTRHHIRRKLSSRSSHMEQPTTSVISKPKNKSHAAFLPTLVHTCPSMDSINQGSDTSSMTMEQSATLQPPKYITPMLKLKGSCTPLTYQAYQGQLYLHLSHQDGMLTVHVDAARHLSSQTASTYVEVALLHAYQDTVSCTQPALGESPQYQESFSYELLEEDLKSRIFIAVRDQENHQLIGAMSFGINRICDLSEPIDGWFYLLDSCLATTSHLRANQSKDIGVAV